MPRRVGHDQNTILKGQPEGNQAFFGAGVVGVRERKREGVAKYSRGFVEAHAVFPQIFGRFPRIPFEVHASV